MTRTVRVDEKPKRQSFKGWVQTETFAMNYKAERLLVAEPNEALRRQIVAVPSEAGYPTVDGILTRAGAETLESIATASEGDSKQMMEEFARRHLIRQIATQGHIGDVIRDRIVYDAQTTSGGSGGPLFNKEGKSHRD